MQVTNKPILIPGGKNNDFKMEKTTTSQVIDLYQNCYFIRLTFAFGLKPVTFILKEPNKPSLMVATGESSLI